MASIADVIKRWRDHNEGNPGRGKLSAGRSFYFQGPIVYTYRMPLARYWGNMVLVQSGFMRPTNAKHRNWVMYNPNMPSFLVPDINGDHSGNLRYLLGKLDEAKRVYEQRYLQRPGHWRCKSMVDDIIDRHKSCVNYEALTGVYSFDIPDLDTLLDEAEKKREAKWLKYSDPAEVAKRERKVARKEARLALFQGEL